MHDIQQSSVIHMYDVYRIYGWFLRKGYIWKIIISSDWSQKVEEARIFLDKNMDEINGQLNISSVWKSL